MGYVAIAKSEVSTNQGFRSLIPNAKTTSEFLYYLLLNNTEYLKSNSTGTTFGELSGSVLKKLVFAFPTLSEQSKIAEILSSLDDKIELNNQMNHTLEKIAKAIFKHWFIDFEFPNSEGKPYRSSGGKMVNSELGEIPEGWSICTLKEITLNFDSKRVPLSSRERQNRKGIYPYYGAASIVGYIDDYLFDGTYLLLGEDGTVIDDLGYPVLQYVWGKFWVNNHAHVLQGKSNFTVEYLYILLQHINVLNLVTGAVQPKISQGNLNSIMLVSPDPVILKNFTTFASTVFEQIKNTSNEILTLAQLRDSLLPRLMNGKIRVRL